MGFPKELVHNHNRYNNSFVLPLKTTLAARMPYTIGEAEIATIAASIFS